MRTSVLLAVIVVLWSSCTATRRTFDGSDFRANRPWWDSRIDAPKSADEFSNLQLDIATYCAEKPIDMAPKTYTFETRMGTRSVTIQTPKCAETESQDHGLAYERAKHDARTRDALQDVLLRLSDEDCEKHRAAIVGTNAGSNLLLSTLASLFSGGATAFAAASTKTALAGTSTFFIASRSHLNEQVYHQIFVGTILKAIEDDRRAALVDIANRRRYPVPEKAIDPRAHGGVISAPAGEVAAAPLVGNAAVDGQQPKADAKTSSNAAATGIELRHSYSIDEAIKDAGDYHARCSFYNGLVRVAVTVERASPCRQIADRREQVLSELTAMKAAGVATTSFKEKFDAYNAELASLNTKLTACNQTGNQ